MNLRRCMVGLVGAFALGVLATAAQAAPAGSATGAGQAAGAVSAVDKVAYRRCVRRDGTRYCRWHTSYRSYHPYYYRVPRVILGIAF